MHHQLQKRGRTDADERSWPRPKMSMTSKRTIIACEECRLRKRRCDSGIPSCSGCMKRMTECVYSSEVESEQWKQIMIQSLRSKLAELENAPEVMSRRTVRDSFHPAGGSEPEQCVTDGEVSGRAADIHDSSNPEQDQLIGTTASEEASIPRRRPRSLTDEHAQPVDVDEGASLSQACTVAIEPFESAENGATSGCVEPCSYEKFMKSIGVEVDRRADTSWTAAQLTPSNGVLAAPHTNNTGCICDRSLDAMQCRLPLRRQADSLVRVYFSRHHRMFPVLHEPTFMMQYEALWESTQTSHSRARKLPACIGLCRQKDKGRLFPATVNVMFSLAALFASPDFEKNADQARHFFQSAETINIFEVLDEDIGIELVQLVLLMGLYLQSTERFSKCWNVAGLAIRMAQNIGLHFNTAEACRRGLLTSRFTQLESEMRARVWYSCVLLEIDVSMSFSQPLMIRTGTKSPRLPEPIDDARLIANEYGKWSAQPKASPSVLEYFTQTIKLYDILRRALENQESNTGAPLDANTIVRRILSLDSEVTEWHEHLPIYLRYESSPTEDASSQDHPPHVLSDTHVVLDLSALSRRLHCRFLHTRQIIFRPALELLSEICQTNKRNDGIEHAKGESLEDSILRNIATQCLTSSIQLIDFLAAQIRSETFLCVWYNITYLHTSGITIVMALFCNLDHGTALHDPVAASLENCLQHLRSYERLSKFARKSSHLLQEGARRICPHNVEQCHNPQPQLEEQLTQLPIPVELTMKTRTLTTDRTFHTMTSDRHGITSNRAVHSEDSNYITSTNLLPASGGFEHQLAGPHGLDLWDSVLDGLSTWNSIPPMSQLDNLPMGFDGSSLMWRA